MTSRSPTGTRKTTGRSPKLTTALASALGSEHPLNHRRKAVDAGRVVRGMRLVALERSRVRAELLKVVVALKETVMGDHPGGVPRDVGR